jgi:hypothetical protein
MKMRPIHRPPRVPADRHPHCAWKVYIDDEGTPYEQHPNLALLRKTLLAEVPIELPSADREPGGWKDYSGPFDPGFQLEDLCHRALLAVCQEAAVQAHLLGRSLLLNVDQRHGEKDARAIGRAQAVGAASIGAHRLKRALGLGDDIAAIVELFRVHPHFLPRTYVDLRAEVTGERSARIEIGDCPALREADVHSWFASLSEDAPALQATAALVNPRARCRPAEPRGAGLAWNVSIDPDAEPLDEPPELKLARLSRGVDFELVQRRPLRA